MEGEFLDVAAVAQLLNLSEVTVRKHAHEVGSKIGKQWRFTKTGIANYINRKDYQCETTHTDSPETITGPGTATSASRASGFKRAALPMIARRRRNTARNSLTENGERRSLARRRK